MQCCYHYKASEQLQFGVDLEGSLLQRDINATFAYQAQIPKSDINIKGTNHCVLNNCRRGIKSFFP